MSMKPNIKYLSLTDLLAAKLHERERLAKSRFDQASEVMAWIMALSVAWTSLLLLVSIQEGWW